MILNDSALSQAPRELIRKPARQRRVGAGAADGALSERFDEIDDPYLRERKADVQQAVERVLKAMMGGQILAEPAAAEEQKLIVVAHDLSPADMILFKRHRYGGFVTDVGGVTSHTAIVARSLGIPALVGLHSRAPDDQRGRTADRRRRAGAAGRQPRSGGARRVPQAPDQLKADRQRLKLLKKTPAATLDGTPIDLYANIELPQDTPRRSRPAPRAWACSAPSSLFLNRKDSAERGRAVRGLSPGGCRRCRAAGGAAHARRRRRQGDERRRWLAQHAQPAMGLRAIRYLPRRAADLPHQLRAILRASHYGKVRILLPMLAHVHEVEQTLILIASCAPAARRARAALRQVGRGRWHDRDPGAALALPIFMRRLNFLSIGTNDLIQYTLAIDRTDDAVAHLYDPLHPRCLTLVANIIQTATRGGCPVAVCGEMAGDLQLTRLLLGLGLRNFSMHPAAAADQRTNSAHAPRRRADHGATHSCAPPTPPRRGTCSRSSTHEKHCLCQFFCRFPLSQWQSYPSRPVKLVVPFPTGSATDQIARVIGQQLQESARPAVRGREQARRARRDRCHRGGARRAPTAITLMVGTNTPLAANPSLFKKLNYDPAKDFAPIARLGTISFMIMVRPDFPAKNLKEFLNYSKANPGKLSADMAPQARRSPQAMLRSMGKLDFSRRAVQGPAAGHHRRARRLDQLHFRRSRQCPGADQGWQAARHRRHFREALAARARYPRHRRGAVRL
jgi:phosphotransferase system enzyme I (PtsI)